MNYPTSYMISTQVYLDPYDQQYRNIVIINLMPEGPLKRFVRRAQMPLLSPFSSSSSSSYSQRNTCVFALTNLRGRFSRDNFMCDTEIPDLFSFLMSNGYKIDTSLTKMMNSSDFRLNNNKIICFITYVGIGTGSA
jgi:predicted lipase